MDCALGISHLPFKMTTAMMLRCAYWAQNQCSYQAAEEAIKVSLGLAVNDDTIRLVANYIGRLVFFEDCKRAEETMKQYDTGTLSYGRSKEGTVYIEVDGAALNTRHRNSEGSTWRENKLGVVFSTDYIHFWRNKKREREHRILQREYISYIGGVEEFKKHVFTCAVRNGYGRYKDAVILSDGAAWIASMAEELFPDAQHILDYFHLCENVYSFAKSKFRMSEELYRPWSEAICKKLKAGQWQEVLSGLNPNEKYENCVNLYHYIEVNQNHINYPDYESKGYFIGSGAIESGNKVVLQKRLKQAGMRWEPETAQYLLTLRTKQESGLWEKDVVRLLYNHSAI